MLWIILFVTTLAGLAYGWIVVRMSSERVTISLDVAKITLILRKAKEGAITALHGARGFREQDGQHSRTGGPS
jgi:hypothetical protein